MTTKRKPALMLTALLALALCLMLAVCVLTACNDGTDITSFDRLEAENRSPIPSEILAALYSYTMQQYESDNFPVTCIDYTKGLDPQRVLTKYPSHGAQATGYNDGFQGYFYNRTEKGLGVFGAIFNSEEEAKNYFIKVGGKFELPESAGSIYSDFTFTVQSNVILALASDIELQSFLDYDLSCLADFEKRAIDILFSLPEIEEYSVYAGIIAINENMQSLYPFEGNVLLEFIREVADNDGKGTSNMYKNDQALLLDQNVKDTVSEINNDNVYYNIDCYTEYSGNWIYSRVSSNPGIAGTLFYSPLGDPYYFIDFYYDENYRPTEVTIPSQINGIETKTIASFNGLPSFVTDLYLPGRDISVVSYRTIDDFRYEGDTTLLTIHGDDWVYQLGDGADNSALKLSAPTGLTFDADSMTLSWEAHPSDMCDGYWLDIRAEYPDGRGDNLAEDVSISADATSLDVSQYVADVLGGIFSATLQFTFYAEHEVSGYNQKTELDSDAVTITYEYDGIEFDPTDKTMVDFSGVQIPRALLNIALNTALILPQLSSEATIESNLRVMSDDEINNMLASNSDILGSLDNVSGALALGLLAISENDLGTDADIFGAAVVFETEAAAQKYAAAQNAKDPDADTRICITFANTVIIIAATQAIDIINLTQGIIPTLNTLMNTPVSGDADETKFIEFFYDTVLHTTDLKEIIFGGGASLGGLIVNAVGYEDEVEGESLGYQTPAVLCETPEIAAELYYTGITEAGMPLRLDGRFVYGSFMIRQNGTNVVFEDLL